jgi:hypothetical protein
MSTPPFVADFDSATGLVRSLGAALSHEPYLRLGRSPLMGRVVHATRALPEAARSAIFARAGAAEAIPPSRLPEVDPEEFCGWVTDQYSRRRAAAVAIGSSNGAVVHLCAAMGIPWLPQTFLVPVRRHADPDDCVADAYFASDTSQALLAAQPGLSIHQMHDPNQDRLMVRHIAYFRMKMRALTATYARFLHQVLAPGGTIVIVDNGTRWPVTRRASRHVYQQGAVGGLVPMEYVDGGPRVDRFLAGQGAPTDRWDYPAVTEWAPEAEWGYESALTTDVRAFAARHGYRVARLRIESPDSMGPVVADLYRDWYAATGRPANRLLVETFICTEPGWTLATRTVPLWLTFGTEPALDVFSDYLDEHSDLAEIAITLFAHGVRSAGYAAADRWLHVARRHGATAALADVDAQKWPSDFATLSSYADALHELAARGRYPEPLSVADAASEISRHGPSRGVEWIAE